MARGDDEGDAAPFNAPFRGLERKVGPPPASIIREKAPAKQPLRPEDDDALFRAAVRGAVPIAPGERGSASAPPTRSNRPTPAQRDRQEVIAELANLVSGIAAFDVSDSDEHVEGAVIGLDPRTVRRLRAGEFAYQAHLDLHGMTVEEAKAAVREFVLRSMVAGHRCVLLIHGRGRNSPDQRGVLKDAVKHWLTRGDLGGRVLAFSTARACDGGSGAMYVLLRRERRGRQPFRTLEGAKS